MKKLIKNFIIITAVTVSTFTFSSTFAMESDQKTTSQSNITEYLRTVKKDIENKENELKEYQQKLDSMKQFFENFKIYNSNNVDIISNLKFMKDSMETLINLESEMIEDVCKKHEEIRKQNEEIRKQNNMELTKLKHRKKIKNKRKSAKK